MATYVAKKPCNFSGTHYLIGERIADGAVLPERAGALLAMGYIEEAPRKSRRKKKEEPAEVPEQEPQIDDDTIPF